VLVKHFVQAVQELSEPGYPTCSMQSVLQLLEYSKSAVLMNDPEEL